MLLTELAYKRIKTKLEYHETLNPKIWDDKTMTLHPDVDDALKDIINAFLLFLKVDPTKVIDVIFTGSNCNYNWSRLSDIDLHIILDYDEICKDCDNGSGFDLDDCFKAKKSLWNNDHDITIKGHDVEVYVAPNGSPVTGNAGVYSLINNEWEQKPVHEDLVYDDAQIKRKAKELMQEINSLATNGAGEGAVLRIKDKISKMRKASLARGGEFSLENLVFKTLRNNGYLQKLSDMEKKDLDDELSLK